MQFQPFASSPESPLQRSRALSSAEIHPLRRGRPANRRFNGAALFRARRCRATKRASGRLFGFNGAALFRARRSGCVLVDARPDIASTEPRSFERGDVASLKRTHRVNELQRSRALSSAEMGSAGRDDREVCDASTEPRSFERGDRSCPKTMRFHALLQRSRALSSAEICNQRRAIVGGRAGFNGAALFRARRSNTATSSSPCPTRFNGAALFRARRFGGHAQGSG